MGGQVGLGATDTSNVASKPATGYVKLIIEWKTNTGTWSLDPTNSTKTESYQSLFEGFGGQVVMNSFIAVPTWSRGVRIKMQARNLPAGGSGSNSRKATRYGFFALAAKR